MELLNRRGVLTSLVQGIHVLDCALQLDFLLVGHEPDLAKCLVDGVQ